MTATKALNWAKKNRNYSWVNEKTKVKDLTPAKKGILMRAYEKSLTKGGSAAKKTTKKKETRKPPPMLKGLNWKMTESKVNKEENYWEWRAKGADWIENPGDTTTYVYSFDSLAGKDIMDADMIRKGMIEDEDGTSYSIAEFTRKYNKLSK